MAPRTRVPSTVEPVRTTRKEEAVVLQETVGSAELEIDRWDVIGALDCLAGVAVIMYAPRG